MTKRTISLLIFFFLMGLYVTTLAPGISWSNGGADGGDLITAVAVNGVPHPSGYPLYLVLAKIFQVLPIKELAYRTNLFSAFCFASAAALLFNLSVGMMAEKKNGLTASVVTALAFGLSPLVWSQAVITEVYGLQALLTVIVLVQTFSYKKTWYFNLIRGITLGLAFGNHLLTLFLLPFLFMDHHKQDKLSFDDVILRFSGLLLGCLIYVVLPLHAIKEPAVNWLNPIDWSSLMDLVSGKIYQSYLTLDGVDSRLRGVAGLLANNFTVIGILLGIYAFLKRIIKGGFDLSLLWLFATHVTFTILYGSKDSYVYLIQAWIVFSIWIGFGIDIAIDILNSIEISKVVSLLLLAVALIARVKVVLPEVDASSDSQADEFASHVLENAPQDAILITEDDEATFTLWYYQYVQRARPDVCVVAEGLLRFDWYQKNLNNNCPTLVVPDGSRAGVYALLMDNNRSYCFVKSAESSELDCYHF